MHSDTRGKHFVGCFCLLAVIFYPIRTPFDMQKDNVFMNALALNHSYCMLQWTQERRREDVGASAPPALSQGGKDGKSAPLIVDFKNRIITAMQRKIMA